MGKTTPFCPPHLAAGGEPCCAVKLFFRTGPEKPISPLRTSFVTQRSAAALSSAVAPHLLGHPLPRCRRTPLLRPRWSRLLSRHRA